MLFPIEHERKVGYIDAEGDVVIEPQFKKAEPFSDGLAWVKRTKRWGAIDSTGELVVQERFSHVFPFRNGFARVMVREDGREGFALIDRAGRRVGEVQAILRDMTADGLAWAQTFEQEAGYLDAEGSWALQPTAPPDARGDFSNGLAWYRDDDLYGYIDPSGETALEPRFERASEFGERVAAVSVSGKLALVDRSGEVVTRTRMKYRPGSLGRFTDGILRITVGNASAWIDESGQRVIEAEFGFASDFVGPYATAGEDSMHQGLIDRSGAYKIPPRFYAVLPTPEGLVRVFPDAKKRGTYGYVTPQGRWIWKPPGLAARWDEGGHLPGCG